MERKEPIEFSLMFPVSYEDYPFDDAADAAAWTVMVIELIKSPSR